MMKSGANKLDQNAIKQFAENGKDASWIAAKMQIPLKVIEAFMPKAELTAGQRGAATRKANAALAQQVQTEQNAGDGESVAA